MTVSHTDFATFAESLQHSESEIDWRMCIGRAYYAAYHRALLSADGSVLGNSPDATGSHDALAERFRIVPGLSGKSIAYVLILMKKARVLADYKIHEDCDPHAATNQVETYKSIVAKLEAFDSAVASKSA